MSVHSGTQFRSNPGWEGREGNSTAYYTNRIVAELCDLWEAGISNAIRGCGDRPIGRRGTAPEELIFGLGQGGTLTL